MAARSVDRPMRILLADVAGPGRRAIAAVLRALPGVELVGELGAGDEIARAVARTSPDALVIDDRLVGGFALGPREAAFPVVVVGLDDDPSFARRADRLGAVAWIAKERADELLAAELERARRWPDGQQPARR